MMIIVNKLSKQTHVKFINELIFKRIAQTLYHIFWKIHDLFESYVSNRNIQFVNHFWKRLIERLKIRIRLLIVYYFEIDNQTKIFNSKIEIYIKIFCVYFQNDWIMWNFFCEFVINNHMFEIIEFFSFFVNFDQHSRISIKFFKN